MELISGGVSLMILLFVVVCRYFWTVRVCICLMLFLIVSSVVSCGGVSRLVV